MTYRSKAAAEIRGRIETLANAVTDEQFVRRPALAAQFGPMGRARCVEDARHHWSHLAAAVDAGIDAIFVDYVGWAKVVLLARNVPESDLAEVLSVMRDVLRSQFDGAHAAAAIAPIEEAIEQLPAMPATVGSEIDGADESGSLTMRYMDALLGMDARAATKVIAEALARGVATDVICVEVLERSQREIGRLWQINAISVAVEHFCSNVTHHLLSQIGSSGRANLTPARKRVVTLCAPGELHDIGLRTIAHLLSLDGWHTIHLGANVPATAAVKLCVEWKPDVVLISASLPPQISAAAEVVRLIRNEPSLQDTRVLVGGRIFTKYPELWRVTGADGSAANATELLALLQDRT